MSRRLRRIERLLRLRSIERELASVGLGAAVRAEDEASAEGERLDTRVLRVELDHAALLRRGTPGGTLHAADAARLRQREIAALGHDAIVRAQRTTFEQREEVAAAERRVRSIETLAERERVSLRRERNRREQRRIDESAVRGRRQWKRLLVVTLLVCFTSASPARASADATTSSQRLHDSFAALRLRQAEQDRRDRELQDREQQVVDFERSVMLRMAELEQLSQQIEARIAAWEEAEGGKSIARLARIYSSMPPARAAGLIGRLDVELATQIIAKMKPKQSSALLALLEESRAQKMSELIAHPLSMEPAAVPEDAR